MTSRPVICFLLSQLLVVVILAAVTGLVLGRQAAISAATGALIALIALGYLTFQTFRFDAAEQPLRAMGAFYRGAAGRYVLAAVLFALAFNYMPGLQAPWVFLGFGVILVTQLIGSVRLIDRMARGNK